MIAQHRIKLCQVLQESSHLEKLLFGLLCADRLQVCCWAFSRAYDYDLEFATRFLDSLAERVLNSELPSTAADTYAGIESRLLSAESFSSPLASQARYGLEATLRLIELCSQDDVAVAIDIAFSVIDAIDNFEYFAWSAEPKGGEFQGDDQNELLQHELRRQLNQAGLVKGADLELRKRLRIENRLFRIPPAV